MTPASPEDKTPPPTTSPAEKLDKPAPDKPDAPQIIVPPPRPKSKLPFILFATLAGALLLIIILLAVITRPRSTPPAVPQITSITPTASDQPSDQTPVSPSPQISRLPITALAGHKLITAYQDKLWLTEFTLEGPRKVMLSDVKFQIKDLSLSPNRQLLAFTYGNPDQSSTGLQVLNLKDKSVTDLIPLSSQVYSHPTWSSDSLYLSIWSPSRSALLFDMTVKRRQLEVTGSTVGQIVFVPGAARISYALDGQLIEVDYAGATEKKILDGINATRPSSSTPDLHYYSADAGFIAFHNTLNQLVLFSRADSSLQVLAEGTGGASFGEVLTIDPTGLLVHTNYGKESYLPGQDDNPIYIYNLWDKTTKPFFQNRKTVILPSTAVPDPKSQNLLLQHQGFVVFSASGSQHANCDYTSFTYNTSSRPLQVWSPDAKYILSLDHRQIADSTSCAISGPFDPDLFYLAVWAE